MDETGRICRSVPYDIYKILCGIQRIGFYLAFSPE
jgi:hypothetical protein